MIASIAKNYGIEVVIRERDSDIRVGTKKVQDDRFEDGNLHIIDDRSLRMQNVLNCGAAYFWKFWHLDPDGVKAFSSISSKVFNADAVPDRRAQVFFDNMRKRYVEKRKSKYRQTSERQVFPKNAVSVFFQGTHPIATGATDVTDFEMLGQVISQAEDIPIIVKPHPFSTTSAEEAKLTEMGKTDDRLIITNANVHDILDHSALTVSINSTVALEGFLHRKPAVLFGKSDFHHFCSTVSSEFSFEAAMAKELTRRSGYEQFLFWYLFLNCIPLNSGKLEELVWQKFSDAGFPKARFCA
ncbi:MAG: hypothetical protein AAGF53_17725 [Pseudomonadota bacterium]